MIIISCKHGTARPMNYHLQTACPLKQAYTFSTIHTAQSNAILTRWRAHETKRTAPCVFCVFQPYRARPMANAGRGRVVEGYREGKTKWEGQARARKPRRRERQSSRSKTPSLTTVAVLYPYSYCTPPPHHTTPPFSLPHSLPPSFTSCTITSPSPHNAGISLQPFRGAASSYLSCPPRPPVLHTRAVELFLSAALFSLCFRS